MLDANPDFVDYDEFAMDDYMNFKYLSPKTYEYDKLEEDDFFLDDYLFQMEEPKIIDEEKQYFKGYRLVLRHIQNTMKCLFNLLW